jgi:hypothetical protein
VAQFGQEQRMARKTKFLSRQNKVPERKMIGTALGPLSIDVCVEG